MQITKNTVVSLNYTLHTLNGEEKSLVESTKSAEPLVYLHGVGMMLPKFEGHVEGLAKGETREFVLAPEDAYGEVDKSAVVNLPVDMFKEVGMPAAGNVIPLQDNQGNQFQARVVEVSPEVVIADLNHPMAGETLHFEVEVVDVREATEEELSHGHAHGADGTEGH